jgi:hypothetical protein
MKVPTDTRLDVIVLAAVERKKYRSSVAPEFCEKFFPHHRRPEGSGMGPLASVARFVAVVRRRHAALIACWLLLMTSVRRSEFSDD